MKISRIIAPGETIIYQPRLSKWAYLQLGHLVRNLTTTIFVSDKRFFHSHGWIHRHAHEIVIGKVESILVEQNLWGRIFNYGTIKVSGTGAGTIVLRYIKRPLEFQRPVRAFQGSGTSSVNG
jgi:uncharacterized membrane protein YdbT with pleckstrin-like domain